MTLIDFTVTPTQNEWVTVKPSQAHFLASESQISEANAMPTAMPMPFIWFHTCYILYSLGYGYGVCYAYVYEWMAILLTNIPNSVNVVKRR